MILPVHDRVRARLAETLRGLYDLDASSMPTLVIEYPPARAMGDLALPVAFELARRLRKAPRAIAHELAGALGAIEGVSRIGAAPNGYVNVFLDRVAFIRERLSSAGGVAPGAGGEKFVVEHTAINPNKAAHIGHIRNAALGDTLVRLLRFRGRAVEVQNYIDDTGVQVADVVVGFCELEKRDLDGVKQVAQSTRFDFYCWDLYARVTEWYEQDRERLKIRAATLHQIEHGGNDAADMGHFIAERIVRAHLRTMGRMNIDYDLLTWEGDILRLKFWAHAFETLKRSGAVFLQTEGKLAGCWVMRIEEDPLGGGAADESDGAKPSDSGDEAESREKVIVRSDGTVTYVGKDIANQLWKFGLLGKDFYYRAFARREDGSALWSTTSDPAADEAQHPHFGGARAVFNVIDTRQAYLQKLLKQALATLGHTSEAQNSTHFSYEMVALSRPTAATLGFAVDEHDTRPFVEVSGRKGLGVKADDLLDRLTASAAAEVSKRNTEFSDDEAQAIGRAIATAAVRYFMVKYSRGKVIAFDIDEALSFEGESGPYLQYSAVRVQNIFHKLRERHGVGEAEVASALATLSPDPITASEGDELWALVLEAARLDEIVEHALRTLELSIVAKYVFGLAQQFNALYHKHQIVNEVRAEVRTWRAAVASYFRQQITTALDLMGCEVPTRM